MHLKIFKSNQPGFTDVAQIKNTFECTPEALFEIFEDPDNWPLLHSGLLSIRFRNEIVRVTNGSQYDSKKSIFVKRDENFQDKITEEQFELKTIALSKKPDRSWSINVARESNAAGTIFKNMRREITCTLVNDTENKVTYTDAFFVDLAFPLNLFFLKPFFIKNTINFILARVCANTKKLLAGKTIEYQPSSFIQRHKMSALQQHCVIEKNIDTVSRVFNNKKQAVACIPDARYENDRLLVSINNGWCFSLKMDSTAHTLTLTAIEKKGNGHFRHFAIFFHAEKPSDNSDATELIIEIQYHPTIKLLGCARISAPNPLHYQVFWPILDCFLNDIVASTNKMILSD